MQLHWNCRASEGKTVEIEYRGPVENTVLDVLGGVRSTCTYVGASKLKELSRRTTFIRATQQLNEVFTPFNKGEWSRTNGSFPQRCLYLTVMLSFCSLLLPVRTFARRTCPKTWFVPNTEQRFFLDLAKIESTFLQIMKCRLYLLIRYIVAASTVFSAGMLLVGHRECM